MNSEDDIASEEDLIQNAKTLAMKKNSSKSKDGGVVGSRQVTVNPGGGSGGGAVFGVRYGSAAPRGDSLNVNVNIGATDGSGLNPNPNYKTTTTQTGNEKNTTAHIRVASAASKKLKTFQTHATQEQVNQAQHAQNLLRQLTKVHSQNQLDFFSDSNSANEDGSVPLNDSNEKKNKGIILTKNTLIDGMRVETFAGLTSEEMMEIYGPPPSNPCCLFFTCCSLCFNRHIFTWQRTYFARLCLQFYFSISCCLALVLYIEFFGNLFVEFIITCIVHWEDGYPLGLIVLPALIYIIEIVFRIGVHSVLIAWKVNCDINGDIESVDTNMTIDFDELLMDDIDENTGAPDLLKFSNDFNHIIQYSYRIDTIVNAPIEESDSADTDSDYDDENDNQNANNNESNNNIDNIDTKTTTATSTMSTTTDEVLTKQERENIDLAIDRFEDLYNYGSGTIFFLFVLVVFFVFWFFCEMADRSTTIFLFCVDVLFLH